MKFESCPAVHAPDKKPWELEVGEYCFRKRDGEDIMWMVVPEADPAPRHISFGENGWTWDGNVEKPTVAPSIDAKDDPDGESTWHGFLTDGVFKACE